MATSFRQARSVLDELDRAHESGQLAAASRVAAEQQTTLAFADAGQAPADAAPKE